MELFHKAKQVRLRSHHEKYLLAEEDEESVCQERNGSCQNARWTVEFIEGSKVLRLKSCYSKYLTATNIPFLFGMTGRKVLQTTPRRLDSSIEWEPIRDGFQAKFKTRYGQFLRANGGLPPWRNSITHDIPHRSSHQDWVLWDVDIVEIVIEPSKPLPVHSEPQGHSSTSRSSSASSMSPKLSHIDSDVSFTGSPPKADGRTIYFAIADDHGNIDDSLEGPSFTFKGNSLEELTHKLEEETGLSDIIICSRNPLNEKLYPLRLQLPPNNITMHVVVVLSSSKVAKEFANTE